MLNLLHPPTLALFIVVLLTTLAALMFFVFKTRKTYAGFGSWTLGFILMAACFMLSVLRLYLPATPTILLSNIAGLASLCLLYDGIASFYRKAKQPPEYWNWGFAMVVIVAMMVNLYQGGDVNIRVIWFNAFQLWISAHVIARYASYARGQQCSATYLLLFAYAGIGLTSFWRIVSMLKAAPMADLMQEDVGYRLLILIATMLLLVLAFCFLLLTHTRIEKALDESCAIAEHSARVDVLTGMWNRRHFELEALREIDRAQRYAQPISLVMFDIDHFKQVNDRYGHLAGDEVLRQIANIVGENIRTSDLASRWGGEEFAILMPAALDQAAHVAEKLRQAVARHDFAQVGKLSISVGCAQLVADENLTGWSRRADAALYRAKEAGRNRVEVSGFDSR